MSEAHEVNAGESSPLLAGFLSEEEMKRQFNDCSNRTLRRYEDAGLPVIVIRGLRLYPIDKARAWLLSHLRKREAPQRGRPRKAA